MQTQKIRDDYMAYADQQIIEAFIAAMVVLDYREKMKEKFTTQR